MITRTQLGAQFVIGLLLVAVGAFVLWHERGIAAVGLIAGILVLSSAAARSVRQARGRGVDA